MVSFEIRDKFLKGSKVALAEDVIVVMSHTRFSAPASLCDEICGSDQTVVL